MRFLVDAQLPPALCRWLHERGHEAAHVAELGLIAADDATIASRAEADGPCWSAGRGFRDDSPARPIRPAVAAMRKRDEPGVADLVGAAMGQH